MTVKNRVSGEPDEVARTLAAIGQVLEVACDGRVYGNRGGFGVRAYAEARPIQAATARAERVGYAALPGRSEAVR